MPTGIRGKIDREYENVQREIERGLARTHASTCEDPVEFCQKQLHFTPTSYQAKLLRDTNQFIVACWSRQSGKSYTVAALILHYTLRYPGSRIAILAPGLRQSRKLLKRVMMFLPRLPGVVDGRLLKSKLELFNGSSIEALPNNPETIRGETLNMIVVDELGFVNDDEELYDAIIFSLGTTNGRFIGLSTPGSRDSLFYQMWTDDQKFPGFSRYHVSYEEALEPNGPLKKEILGKIKQQMALDPWRWQREMEAEFAEDEDSYYSLALIKKCVSYDLTMLEESTVLARDLPLEENYFVGVDLGQKRDHSVVALVAKKGQDVTLVHLKQFRLGTEYSQVLGYLRLLNEGSEAIRRIYIDQPGVGEVFLEEAVKSGLKNATGINLSLPSKQQILVYMKQVMEAGRLRIPYGRELINEMNVERYELTKTGQLQFSHPEGTHDDRLWAVALAIYASRPDIPTYHPVAALGKVIKPSYQASTRMNPKQSLAATGSVEICIRCGQARSADHKCPFE